MPLRLGERLHAEAVAAQGVHFGIGVPGHAPVGADNAVIFIGAPEQVLEEVFAVRIAHILSVFDVRSQDTV